jgi:hypothetical protein
MNKKIILTGDACTGKTFSAFNAASFFDSVVYLDVRDIKKPNRFLFSEVTEKTELIILDEIKPENFRVFEDLIMCKVMFVEKRGKAAMKIDTPKIILIIEGSSDFLKNYGVSFLHRCKIIECSRDRHLFLHKEIKFHNSVNQLIN